MAGLGEVCSHIGAILFAAEYAHSKKQTLACTDLLSLWTSPSLSTQVPIVPVHDMDWGQPYAQKCFTDIPSMTQEEVVAMLNKASEIDHGCVLMRVVEPFATKIAEETAKTRNPMKSIFNIFDESHLNKTYAELMMIAKNIPITIDREQINLIDQATRSQSLSRNWFIQRAGRITASKFKLVCRTDKNKPSLSLVKTICYPTELLFNTKATIWGTTHENVAVEEYRQHMEESHQGFLINDVGLIVSEKWPQFGASPDRIVYCDCCLGGCLEIKCPYSLETNKIGNIEDYLKLKSSCLHKENELIKLKKDHSYYYQVQMQIFVTGLNYCDFVIWSPRIFFHERISPDWEFWNKNSEIAIKFHAEVIMPELLGRYFTRDLVMPKIINCCFCHGVDDGRPMIRCEEDNCNIQWFHLECVGLEHIPENCVWDCNKCVEIEK